MSFLTLLPMVMSLIGGIFGPGIIAGKVEDRIKTDLISAGASVTKEQFLKIVVAALGNVEQTKLDMFTKQMDALVDQYQVEAYVKSPEGFYYKGWRPFLSWGISIIVVIHLAIVEIYNLKQFFEGHSLQPLDYLTVLLITSLLGIYMTGRTAEKIKVIK